MRNLTGVPNNPLGNRSVSMALLVKSRCVTLGHIPLNGLYQSWPSNNPHPLNWLYHSLW